MYRGRATGFQQDPSEHDRTSAQALWQLPMPRKQGSCE